MTITLSLQIFLLIDAFVIGVLSATALRHGLAHFRPNAHDAERTHASPQNGHLPPAVREQLIAEAQANFKTVLDHSAKELQADLETTATQIKKQLDKQGAEAVASELSRYHAKLDELQQQTTAAASNAGQDLEAHQTDLKAKMAEEIAAEKERLLQQIDTKLADAVASFLTDTLQHNVDLGAQTAYLTTMLEEHKADFKTKVSE